jgi:hypothetical protein
MIVFRHRITSLRRKGSTRRQAAQEPDPAEAEKFTTGISEISGEFRGASASLIFRLARRKTIQIVFSGGVYLGKNSSQPASVQASPASERAQQAANLLVSQKCPQGILVKRM